MLRKFLPPTLPLALVATLTLIAGLGSPLRVARAAPNGDGVTCLASSTLLQRFPCLAEGSCVPGNGEGREFIDNLRAHALESAQCYSRIGATHAFRPAAGEYLIWRNVDHDLWVKLKSGAGHAPRVLAALANVAPLLKMRFPALNYEGVLITPAPIKFDGIATLERGYSLGSATGRQAVDAKAFMEAVHATQKQLDEAQADAKTCVDAPTSAQCADAMARTVAVAKELRGHLVGEAAAAARAAGTASTQTQAAQDQGSEGAGTPDATGTTHADATDASGELGGGSDVEGSGGILPAGAPPWIADLLDMILTYFGVSEVVKGATLALFLLAPDVVSSLASFTASLTKGLNNADLNKGFAAIKQLYQFYNALSSAMDNLSTMAQEGGFKNVGTMLMETGKVIEALPPALQSELTTQLGQQIQEIAEDAAALTGAIDPEVLSALVSGDADAALEALGEEASRQAEAELRRQAHKLIERELGVDLTKFAGVAQALVDGDRDAAVAAAERYVEHEVADRLGVDPELLTAVRSGNAPLEKVQSLAAERVAAKLAEVVGLPALGQKQLRAVLRDPAALDTIVQGIAEKHERVQSWLAGLAEGQVPPELVREGQAYLRARLPNDLRNLDLTESPETLAVQYIRAKHGKDIDRLTDALSKGRDLAALAEDFPSTVERLRTLPKLQPSEIKKHLVNEAERRVRRELETALGEPLQRGVDALEVSAGVRMQIKAHLIEPDAKKLASVIWHESRRRLESAATAAGSLSQRVRTCVDTDAFKAPDLSLEQATSDLVASLKVIEPGVLPIGRGSVESWVVDAVAEHCPTGTRPKDCARASCSAVRDAIATHISGLDAYVIRGKGLSVNVAEAAALLVSVDQMALAPPSFESLRRAVAAGDAAAMGKEVTEGLIGLPSDAEAREAWLQERLVATGVSAAEAAAAVAACAGNPTQTCLAAPVTRNGEPVTSWSSLVEDVVASKWKDIEAARLRVFSDFQATCGAAQDFGEAVAMPAFSKEAAHAVLLGTDAPEANTLAAQLMCCQDRCTVEKVREQVSRIADAATARAGGEVGELQGLLAGGSAALNANLDQAVASASKAIVAAAGAASNTAASVPLAAAIDTAARAAADPTASSGAERLQTDAIGLLKLKQLQELATCVKKARVECSASDADWKIAPCSDERARCEGLAQGQRAGDS